MKRPLSSPPLWIMLPLACCLAGCPFIGWTVNAFAPPKKVQAQYSLPKDKKILVFVDDILNPVSYAQVKADLAEELNRQLIEHKVAGQTIAHEDLLNLMAATAEFNQLGVVQIGQKLGADLVLYVHIDQFSLKDSEESPLWAGKLKTKVRLIDVQRGLSEKKPRLWPLDRDAFPVKPAETPSETHPSPRYGEDLAKALAVKMADRIAKLFYTHEVSAQEAIEEEQHEE